MIIVVRTIDPKYGAVVEVVFEKDEFFHSFKNIIQNISSDYDELKIDNRGIYNSVHLPFKYLSVNMGSYSLPDNAVTDDMLGKEGCTLNIELGEDLLEKLSKQGIEIRYNQQFIHHPEVDEALEREMEKEMEKINNLRQ